MKKPNPNPEIPNKEYEAAVNRLIGLAERNTDRQFPFTEQRTEMRKTKDGSPWVYSLWTEYFHAEMNRLCREEGIRNI